MLSIWTYKHVSKKDFFSWKSSWQRIQTIYIWIKSPGSICSLVTCYSIGIGSSKALAWVSHLSIIQRPLLLSRFASHHQNPPAVASEKLWSVVVGSSVHVRASRWGHSAVSGKCFKFLHILKSPDGPGLCSPLQTHLSLLSLAPDSSFFQSPFNSLYLPRNPPFFFQPKGLHFC